MGCKKENTAVITEKNQRIQLDSLSKDKINIKVLKLSSEAQKEMEGYEDFQNLKNLMQSMSTSNPFHIKKYSDSVNTIVQVFNESLLENLKVNTITSRIKVLSTESGLLMQLTENDNADPQKLMDANLRLTAAYNSLIIQLNELSLAIPENIEKELLRERDILRDSILDVDENQQKTKN